MDVTSFHDVNKSVDLGSRHKVLDIDVGNVDSRRIWKLRAVNGLMDAIAASLNGRDGRKLLDDISRERVEEFLGKEGGKWSSRGGGRRGGGGERRGRERGTDTSPEDKRCPRTFVAFEGGS